MKKILRKTIKSLIVFIVSSLSIIGIYFLSAAILSRIEIKGNTNEPKEIDMYIITNGMHTDLVFPVKSEVIDWSKKIKFSETKSKDSIQKYIAIGWGDKGFFLDVPDWDHVKFSIAFKAAFGLSTTAIHTTYMKNITEDESCRKIKISNTQYQKLIKYIENSFQKDTNGNIINIVTDKAYGNNDAFYEAKGKYSFLFTCNTWANTSLKSAGLPSCLWTPFQEGIFRLYN